MKIELIGVATILIGLIGLLKGPSFSIAAFAVSTLLGSAAAVQMPALGGSSVPPATLMLGFFLATLFLRPQFRAAMPAALSYPGPGFWLLAVTAYGVISAVLLPRIFGDLISVYPLSRVDATQVVLTSLAPSASNVTQALYLTADLACFVGIAALAMAGGLVLVAQAVILAAVANLCFVAIDTLTYLTGAQDVLSVIRNANYSMFENGDVEGVRRLIGSFTEAGAFAYATIGLFSFCLILWLQGIRTRTAGLLATLLLVALLLSTSSAGYGALLIYGGCVYLACAARSLIGRATVQQFSLTLALPVLVLLIVVAAMSVPSVWNGLSDFYDSVFSNKFESESGVERSLWNDAAIQNFFDTFGFGAGLGSVRASGFAAAVLSNMGIIGALLFAAFFASLAIAATRPQNRSIEAGIGRAAAGAWFALLIQALIDAGSPDLGLGFCLFAAVSAAPGFKILLEWRCWSAPGTASGVRAFPA